MHTHTQSYPSELLTLLDANDGLTPSFRIWYARLAAAVETYNGKHSTHYDPCEVIDFWAEEKLR